MSEGVVVLPKRADVEIGGQSCGRTLARPRPGKEMTEQWRAKATDELWVFITPRVAGG